MEHSAECLDAQRRFERAITEYYRAWPHVCETCRGWGGKVSSYDPSPAGVALSPGCYYDFEPCPDCVDAGTCPRCSAGIEISGLVRLDLHIECAACGWSEKNPCGLPEHPECFCWEEEIARIEENAAERACDRGEWFNDDGGI